MKDVTFFGLELHAWLVGVINHADKDRLVLELHAHKYLQLKVTGQVVLFRGYFMSTERLILRIRDIPQLYNERNPLKDSQVSRLRFKRELLLAYYSKTTLN